MKLKPEEQIEKNRKKIKELQNANKKLSNRLTKEERDKRTRRLCNKAGQLEALFAFAHMSQYDNMEFLFSLAEIPEVKKIIVDYHLATGGTQYKNVDELGAYMESKKEEIIKDAKMKREAGE